MLDVYQKRKIRQFLYSKPFLVFLCVPVIFFTHVAFRAYTTAQEAKEKHLALAAELARLEERASMLSSDLATLNDPRGMEAELRKRYEVGKEGEELVVLVDEELPDDATNTRVVSPQKSLWKRILEWF